MEDKRQPTKEEIQKELKETIMALHELRIEMSNELESMNKRSGLAA